MNRLKSITALFSLFVFSLLISSCDEDSNITSLYRYALEYNSTTAKNPILGIKVLEDFSTAHNLSIDKSFNGSKVENNNAQAESLFNNNTTIIDQNLEELKSMLKEGLKNGQNGQSFTFSFTYRVSGTYALGEESSAFRQEKKYTVDISY